ncbi:hypothetical protein KUA08_07110, partial [Komagataeibacter melomenusus]|uniref:hypothetical protein n=1 Tax=Komagataeibacter melomenusus TaxID=2766578 RepID=UPI001C2DC1BE
SPLYINIPEIFIFEKLFTSNHNFGFSEYDNISPLGLDIRIMLLFSGRQETSILENGMPTPFILNTHIYMSPYLGLLYSIKWKIKSKFPTLFHVIFVKKLFLCIA